MKFSTSTIVCTALLSSSTALAGTWRPIERRQYWGNAVANAGNVNVPAGAINYANSAMGWAAAKREVPETTTGTTTQPQDPARVRLTPKQRAIHRAQRHNATEAQITFLNTVPDETFEKMSTMRRKFGQAVKALWKGTVPDLNALPVDGDRPPRAGTMRRPGGEGKGRGGRASPKEWVIRWAAMSGATAEQVQALVDTPDAEFTALRDMPLKDRLIKEAELMKSDKVEFFKTGVPQTVFDELNTLETTMRNAHKQLKNGQIPTL